MKRGDVVTATVQGDYGKPQPAVVVQSDLFNETHPSVTVPLTSMIVDAPLIRPHGRSWWIGWAEEIPGINCQGASREELMENLRSALREMLAMNRDVVRKAGGAGFEEVRISALYSRFS